MSTSPIVDARSIVKTYDTGVVSRSRPSVVST